MVGIEVIQEVAADNFAGHTLAAERICDELEVFFQRFLAVDSFHPLHKPSGDVIVEVVIIADGDDIVRVNRERLVVSLCVVVKECAEVTAKLLGNYVFAEFLFQTPVIILHNLDNAVDVSFNVLLEHILYFHVATSIIAD